MRFPDCVRIADVVGRFKSGVKWFGAEINQVFVLEIFPSKFSRLNIEFPIK